MRIPANIISKGKYTIGNEYLYLDTHKEYQGFYYELSNKFFAGVDFDPNAKEIIKKDSAKVNKLLLDPKTEEYGKISQVQLPNSTPPPPLSDFFDKPSDLEEYNAYFYKKMIGKNILIKEISKETYGQYINNPIYQVIKVKVNNGDAGITNEELKRADKEMPGFATWYLDGKSG
jgi:hypothetical protein